MSPKLLILGLAVVFGLGAWVADAFIGHFVFHDGSLWGLMTTEIPHGALHERLVAVAACLGLGVAASLLIAPRTGTYRKLKAAHRALTALTACSEALVRIGEEIELSEEICRTLVDVGGYRLAWVGYAEHDAAKSVRPVALGGQHKDYVDFVNLTWADTERGRCPAGRAIRTGQPVVARDILTDPFVAPWRERARKCGFRSAVALPLALDERILGTLNVYAARPNAFDETELRLLSQLADDLTYGIAALRARVEQRRAAEVLRQEKAKAQQYLDVAGVMIVAIDSNHGVSLINPKGCEVLGYPAEEVLGRVWFDTFVPERMREKVRTVFAQLMAGDVDPVEYHENLVVTRSGQERIIAWHNGVIRDENGRITGILGSGEDITARRQAEACLARRTWEFESLAENAPDCIARFDSAVRFVFMNKRLAEVTGISREHHVGKTGRELGVPDQIHDLWDRSVSDVFETHQPQEIEFDFEGAAGPRCYHARIVPE